MQDLLADLIGALENADFYSAQSTSYGGQTAQLDMSDGATILSVSDSATALIGSDGGTELMGGPCAVVSWLGSWHYRGGKPRTYVGGLTEGWVDGPSQLDAGHRASLTTAAVAAITLIAALSGSYGGVVILGALLGNSPTANGTFAPFTGAVVKDQVGSQRRRNRAH
jgi:hypothetical protein